jgi:hypothetical protein
VKNWFLFLLKFHLYFVTPHVCHLMNLIAGDSHHLDVGFSVYPASKIWRFFMISQFAQMGATWVSTVQKPYGAHMGEVVPIFPGWSPCDMPRWDHNLTLMAQLPPIWAPYVLLAGYIYMW